MEDRHCWDTSSRTAWARSTTFELSRSCSAYWRTRRSTRWSGTRCVLPSYPCSGADRIVQAAEAMGAISDPSSLAILRPYLTHENRSLRETAEIAVAKIEWDNSVGGKASATTKYVLPSPPSPLTNSPQRLSHHRPRTSFPLPPRLRSSLLHPYHRAPSNSHEPLSTSLRSLPRHVCSPQ